MRRTVYIPEISKLARLKEGKTIDELKTRYPKAHYASPPKLEKIKSWLNDGYSEATDGCRVEPDGTCPHSCESWLIVMGCI